MSRPGKAWIPWTMKWLFRTAWWVLAALLVVVITLALNEVIIFASRTEAGAQGQAKQDFLSECARRGLNPSAFTGPQRIKSPPGTFGFVWVNPSDGNQIATMVKYFPAGVESWLTRHQDGKFEPYCDGKNISCE